MGCIEWTPCGTCTRWLQECTCSIIHTISEDVHVGELLENVVMKNGNGEEVMKGLNAAFAPIDRNIYVTNDMRDAIKSCSRHERVFESPFVPCLHKYPLKRIWSSCAVFLNRSIVPRNHNSFLVIFYGVCMNTLREHVEDCVWGYGDLESLCTFVRENPFLQPNSSKI